jgi:hypothetical protein
MILAINWICYVRVINGYFLADDFLHIAYLKQVFDGDWPSLLKNFVGNWMQAEGTTFYRPLISLTLAFDYFFFGANASGFHLSNLFFQTASSLLLYLVVTEIGRIFIAPAVSASETTAGTGRRSLLQRLAFALRSCRLDHCAGGQCRLHVLSGSAAALSAQPAKERSTGKNMLWLQSGIFCPQPLL